MVLFLHLSGFFPSLWSHRRASRAIKMVKQRTAPSPFPLSKNLPELCAVELLHRQKTYNAVVSIVLMCGTLKKKIHTKGVGRMVASRE